MIDRSAQTLVLAIEGLPQRHCWPAIPSYGDSNYTLTLREPPGGTSASWDVTDQTATVGGWSVEFTAAASWYRIAPSPIAFLDVATELGEDWMLDRTPAQAGIVVDGYYIVDRETVQARGPLGSGTALKVTRERYGSEAAPHKFGAAIFALADPPALSGRRATIWRVPRTGGTASTSEVDANVYLRGHIPREVRQTKGQRVKIDVHTGGDRRPNKGPQLNANPTPFRGTLAIEQTAAGLNLRYAQIVPLNPMVGVDPLWTPPLHAEHGAYVYYPDVQVVVAIPYLGDSQWAGGSASFEWAKPGASIAARVGDEFLPCYQVVYSDPTGPYPTFGYLDESLTYVPSANPVVIAANLLVSRDGTGGIYDRGDYLYPWFSLGLDYDRLDWPTWLDAIAENDGIEADRLWLGGPKPRDLHAVLRALLAPCGLTPVVTQAGLWTLARLSDLYPREGVAVSAADGQSGWEALGRPLERIVLQTDPGPDGESSGQVSLSDLTASEWFPREMGGTDTIELAPYQSAVLQEHATELATVVGARLRRLSQRTAVASVELGPTDADGLEVGDPVLLSDPLVRDPVDGTMGGVVPARVTRMSSRAYEGSAEVDLLLLDGTARLALRCPSAEVVSWDSATKTLRVLVQRYAIATAYDADQFDVGDAVRLSDRNGVPRSDLGDPTGTYVVSVDGESGTIVVDANFLDAAGLAVTPAQGDILSYSYFTRALADGPATQTDDHAWMASGGLGAPALTGSTPYVFGG